MNPVWGGVYTSHWKSAASSTRANKQVFPNRFRAVWKLFWCCFWPLLSCGSELYQAPALCLWGRCVNQGTHFIYKVNSPRKLGLHYMQRVLVGLSAVVHLTCIPPKLSVTAQWGVIPVFGSLWDKVLIWSVWPWECQSSIPLRDGTARALPVLRLRLPSSPPSLLDFF